MLNDDLKREIDKLFFTGFQESLSAGADPGELSFKDVGRNDDIDAEQFYLLTISSQLFRLFVIIHFNDNEVSKNFAANALGVNSSSLTTESFYDYLGEVGNTFCGYLKRELNKTVPHLGMSTPNRLSVDCYPYIADIKSDYEQHAVAEYQGQPLFRASTFLSADQELNYTVQAQTFNHTYEEESDSGELELF